MRIINLTHHCINVFLKDGVISYPPDTDREVVRVETIQKRCSKVDDIPIMQTIYQGSNGNLPPEEKDTMYIVSSLVGMSNPGRKDLVCPNTHPKEIIRNREGNILGVKSFQCFWSG